MNNELSEQEENTLKEITGICLQQLYQNDLHLIEAGGMEQSVAFRFAIYFHEAIKDIGWFNGLHLDMEYNKNGKEAKKTPRKGNGARPDLIFHSRGNNERNTLIIEFKGIWNREGIADDVIKLEDFTDQEGIYAYGLGLLVVFHSNQSTLHYFKDGVEI